LSLSYVDVRLHTSEFWVPAQAGLWGICLVAKLCGKVYSEL